MNYDFSTSYFRVNVDVTLSNATTAAAGATMKNGNGYVRFERGLGSIIRRVSFRMLVVIYWKVLTTTMICIV